VIFNIEEEEALRTRCPGSWTRIAAVDNIGIWRLEQSAEKTSQNNR
jgi:hypothetical protein